MQIHCPSLDECPGSPCDPQGNIAWKFFAVGRHVVYGDHRSHLAMVQWMLAGPLSHHDLPTPRAAEEFFRLHRIPFALGHLTRQGEIVFSWYPELRAERDNRYEQRLERTLRDIWSESAAA